MANKTICGIAAWRCYEHQGCLYLPYVHYVYIKQMSKLYQSVYLLVPAKKVSHLCNDYQPIQFDNVDCIKMPWIKSYLDAQRYRHLYKKAIMDIADRVDVFYCRVPDPFCWMPAKYTDKPVIMHFVGDIIEATKQNIKFSALKKSILVCGYLPEQRRIENSARKSKVYTNGIHLARRLEKKGISACPVISSTVSITELAKALHSLQSNPFRLIYIGYLRYAKGMDTLMDLLLKLKEMSFNFTFDIVGEGEMYKDISEFIKSNNLETKVTMHGHIDDRKEMLSLLQKADLFFFPSLSEGSPRVVIEAMSQGTPVLSTPVGSLPDIFEEGKEIIFFAFKNAEEACKKIVDYSNRLTELDIIRKNAYSRVKNEFTIEKFLSKVFLMK